MIPYMGDESPRVVLQATIDLDALADAIVRAQGRLEAAQQRAAEEAERDAECLAEIGEALSQRLNDPMLQRRWWNRRNNRLGMSPGYSLPHAGFADAPQAQEVLELARSITDEEIANLRQSKLRSY
ncbi:MAG: hypothetical protein B7C54_05690 [Acidimicrobiales bacterium mtb01]|nr:MAG: hypothetical protein B7C54_05690 [Acidimicrobiales bacterium mtb01]